MKKTHLVSMLGLVTMLVLAAAAVAQAAAVITIQGFEEDIVAPAAGVSGWKTWTNDPEGFIFAYDTVVKNGGERSVRMSPNNPREAASITVTYTLYQPEPGDYLLTYWVKTEGLVRQQDWAGALGRVICYAQTNEQLLNQIAEQRLNGTNDWTFVEMLFTIPEGTDRAVFDFGLFRSIAGTAWFDDVSIVQL